MADGFRGVDWALIQTFLAVAETGSLTQAAGRLGISQPTAGRQIKALEDALEVTLFTRQARGLRLTETGAVLLEHAHQMQASVRAFGVAAAGRSENLSGPVRITASVFTAHHILPPILAQLRKEEPDISIDLVPNDAPDNLLFREADIAVRMFRSEQLDIITQYLGGLELGLFAARSYLDGVKTPTTARELFDLDLVGFDRSDLMIAGMREFGMSVTRDQFATRCDQHCVYFELVRAGCGVGATQVTVANSYPEMVRLLPNLPIRPLPVWLAAHEAMRQSPRIRRVWDHLARHLSAAVAPVRADRPS